MIKHTTFMINLSIDEHELAGYKTCWWITLGVCEILYISIQNISVIDKIRCKETRIPYQSYWQYVSSKTWKLTTQIQDGLLLLFGHTAGIGECLYFCKMNNNVMLKHCTYQFVHQNKWNTLFNTLQFFSEKSLVFLRGGVTHLHLRGHWPPF